MARNSKSRKLRNRKMRGGGDGDQRPFYCRWFGIGCPKGDTSTQANVPIQSEQTNTNVQPAVEGSVQPQPQPQPQLRGGKSNRRNKSKKSRRTRRR